MRAGPGKATFGDVGEPRPQSTLTSGDESAMNL
jgi:hypothetical protein